jgi:hypothetical protein
MVLSQPNSQPRDAVESKKGVDALDFPHLGETRVDGRIGRVVVRCEIGHGTLGALLSLAEAI